MVCLNLDLPILWGRQSWWQPAFQAGFSMVDDKPPERSAAAKIVGPTKRIEICNLHSR
jgi:hypothetical protein